MNLNLTINEILPFIFFISSKISPIEYQKLVSFVTDFKKLLDRGDLMFTLTINLTEKINYADYATYNISKLAESSEFINFVFDYKRIPENNTIGDALKSFHLESTQDRIADLMASGVSKTKIVLGLHFTAPGFIIASNGTRRNAQFYQAYGYRSISEAQFLFPLKWDTSIGVNNESSMNVIVESSRSIANKVRYAVVTGLAGVAPIYISFDEFYGLCNIDKDTFIDFETDLSLSFTEIMTKRKDRTFPLLHTINEAIVFTTELTKRGLNNNHRGPIVAPVMTPSPLFKLTTPLPKPQPDRSNSIMKATQTTSNGEMIKQFNSNSDSETVFEPSTNINSALESLVQPESSSEPILVLSTTQKPSQGGGNGAISSFRINTYYLVFGIFGTVFYSLT